MEGPSDPAELLSRIRAAVLAHPQVARLDGGPFGTVASHLPGRRRVLGVRLVPGAVELAVVARLGLPLPQLAAELADAVRPLLPDADVDVTVSGVVPALVVVPPGPAPTR